MRPAALGALVAGCIAACATATPLPADSQTVLSPDERKPLALIRPDSAGLERFWKRPGVNLGIIKWDSTHSKVLRGAPPDLMRALRDEAGRLNQTERPGEDVWLTLNVYRWTTSIFSKIPRASVEVVGRDRAGQVVWMGQGQIIAEPRYAESLADSPAQIVASETVRRLRAELGM